MAIEFLCFRFSPQERQTSESHQAARVLLKYDTVIRTDHRQNRPQGLTDSQSYYGDNIAAIVRGGGCL
jgi:hypothetical protein